MLSKLCFGLAMTVAGTTVAVAVIGADRLTFASESMPETSPDVLPEGATPAAVEGHQAKGWVIPDASALDRWFKPAPKRAAEPAHRAKPKAKHVAQKERKYKSASVAPVAKPKRPTKSSMHQDLDKIFSKSAKDKRTGWQRDRIEYDRWTKGAHKSRYSGTFPGRS